MRSEAVRYAIHDLIDVLVDSRVNDSVIEQIDFQIGYFKITEDQPLAPHQIIVKPYGDFAIDPALSLDTFHLVRGIPRKILDDPRRRVAIEKGQSGYIIYADSPFLINLYIQLLLVQHGISLVHAAAVADESGRVTLFPGAGGVGKTALLGYLVKEHNYRTLGDDITGLTTNGECISFPRSFVLKEYHRSVYPEIFQRLNIGKQKAAESVFIRSLERFVKENAPFKGVARGILQRMGLLSKFRRGERPFLAALPVEEILGTGAVVDRGSIHRIVFLQRYSGDKFQAVSISEEMLSRRMFAILQHEWVSIMRELFTLGALEMLDLSAYFDRVSGIIASAIARRKCDMLLIPDGALPEELLGYFISIL